MDFSSSYQDDDDSFARAGEEWLNGDLFGGSSDKGEDNNEQEDGQPEETASVKEEGQEEQEDDDSDAADEYRPPATGPSAGSAGSSALRASTRSSASDAKDERSAKHWNESRDAAIGNERTLEGRTSPSGSSRGKGKARATQESDGDVSHVYADPTEPAASQASQNPPTQPLFAQQPSSVAPMRPPSPSKRLSPSRSGTLADIPEEEHEDSKLQQKEQGLKVSDTRANTPPRAAGEEDLATSPTFNSAPLRDKRESIPGLSVQLQEIDSHHKAHPTETTYVPDSNYLELVKRLTSNLAYLAALTGTSGQTGVPPTPILDPPSNADPSLRGHYMQLKTSFLMAQRSGALPGAATTLNAGSPPQAATVTGKRDRSRGQSNELPEEEAPGSKREKLEEGQPPGTAKDPPASLESQGESQNTPQGASRLSQRRMASADVVPPPQSDSRPANADSQTIAASPGPKLAAPAALQDAPPPAAAGQTIAQTPNAYSAHLQQQVNPQSSQPNSPHTPVHPPPRSSSAASVNSPATLQQSAQQQYRHIQPHPAPPSTNVATQQNSLQQFGPSQQRPVQQIAQTFPAMPQPHQRQASMPGQPAMQSPGPNGQGSPAASAGQPGPMRQPPNVDTIANQILQVQHQLQQARRMQEDPRAYESLAPEQKKILEGQIHQREMQLDQLRSVYEQAISTRGGTAQQGPGMQSPMHQQQQMRTLQMQQIFQQQQQQLLLQQQQQQQTEQQQQNAFRQQQMSQYGALGPQGQNAPTPQAQQHEQQPQASLEQSLHRRAPSVPPHMRDQQLRQRDGSQPASAASPAAQGAGSPAPSVHSVHQSPQQLHMRPPTRTSIMNPNLAQQNASNVFGNQQPQQSPDGQMINTPRTDRNFQQMQQQAGQSSRGPGTPTLMGPPQTPGSAQPQGPPRPPSVMGRGGLPQHVGTPQSQHFRMPSGPSGSMPGAISTGSPATMSQGGYPVTAPSPAASSAHFGSPAAPHVIPQNHQQGQPQMAPQHQQSQQAMAVNPAMMPPGLTSQQQQQYVAWMQQRARAAAQQAGLSQPGMMGAGQQGAFQQMQGLTPMRSVSGQMMPNGPSFNAPANLNQQQMTAYQQAMRAAQMQGQQLQGMSGQPQAGLQQFPPMPVPQAQMPQMGMQRGGPQNPLNEAQMAWRQQQMQQQHTGNAGSPGPSPAHNQSGSFGHMHQLSQEQQGQLAMRHAQLKQMQASMAGNGGPVSLQQLQHMQALQQHISGTGHPGIQQANMAGMPPGMTAQQMQAMLANNPNAQRMFAGMVPQQGHHQPAQQFPAMPAPALQPNQQSNDPNAVDFSAYLNTT